MAVCELISYAEAATDKRWVQTMEQQMLMVEKNGTWLLVDKPIDQHVIGTKWIFETKVNAAGTVNKYKARLVVKRLTKDDGTSRAGSSMYRSIIGSLLYLTASRPNIMFSASLLSRFMQSPSQTHFAAAKRVLRYIKGIIDLGLKFEKKKNSIIMGYCDTDWAGSLDDSKGTFGYCFSLGSAVFNWNSKKQEVVAQSSVEAEYITIATATNHYGRIKHIKVKFHVIREVVKDEEVDIQHCGTIL
ncbi:DNA/RNA polymerases superfamily protein [Theobroma cacao]|uniref:DNA/RNA polymerases superfamily protein n=1 Tax=Theobroma cacao TaxID=3641 RepID=A0A061FMJ4_THECC|nr:DNA/RNA polymerases superfamily protein [Theobroma cacao]